MTGRPTIDEAVGRSLNRLRQERGLSVTALARSAAVSQAMISRIENGQVSPSLTTLSALAEALAVPVMALLAEHDPAADIHHVKAGQGLASRRVTQDHAHDYLLLGKHAGPGGSFQAARIRIDREGAGRLPIYQHEGHAFIQMLAGRALYRCGSERIELEEGDSLSFDTKLAHGFAEILTEYVEFITVSTRPNA